MMTAVCSVPVTPMRKDPSHKSEMVSQLIFGEYCRIHESSKDQWVRISGQYDGYEGWCRDDQIAPIEPSQYQTEDKKLTSQWVSRLEYNGLPMMVPFGSSLANLHNGLISWRSNKVSYSGETWIPQKDQRDIETIKRIACTFLNTPYLWGGKSIFGIDCSGFTQMVFKFLDIPIFRDAQLQALQGETLGFLEESACGDLAFFDNEEGRITHVGILLNDQAIIHASGKVRIDRIDNIGIIHKETLQRTHSLRLIKRYQSPS